VNKTTVASMLLVGLQSALLVTLFAHDQRLILQDEAGKAISGVLPYSSTPTAPARRFAGAPGGSACQIDQRVTIARVAAVAQFGCEYCYFIPGPYGCNDSECYDFLCQYVGVCAGCRENYFPHCSGCAQDQYCDCCQ
jgi:hypothetical protein